ncbi:MAG: AMP-binding protein [Chloroflexota bacterium]|nr:MAG: AMP-binding protein [Chloroflexota bacterium]
MKDNSPASSEKAGSVLPFEEQELERTVLDRFALVVAHFPDNPAILTMAHSFTYRALDEAANRVAQAILAKYDSTDVPVAILMGHGALPIVALLGVLKSGSSFVMLDVLNHASWLSDVLQDSMARLVITDTQHLPLAFELAHGHQLLNIDQALDRLPGENEHQVVMADNPLAIFYTSGSTGKPKGVVLTHRYLLHYVWASGHYYEIMSRDRLTGLFSYSYAASMPNVFEALLSGATLYPLDVRDHTATQVSDWLAHHQITICHPPVSLYRQLIGSLGQANQALNLRMMILGGQTMTQEDVVAFREVFPTGCGLLNRLSSTETGLVACAFVESRLSGERLPVGYPVAGKSVLLLDEDGRPVRMGETGEITVKSKYIAAGYWQQSTSVRAKFLPDPEDSDGSIYMTGDLGRMDSEGLLYHYGRKDFLVKIRGYRVELQAIEQALRRVASVQDAAVIADSHSGGDPRLIAYIISATQPAASSGALRDELRQSLPHYMLPSQFVIMAAFPQTASGKIDRQALPQPETARPELANSYIAPRSSLERELVRLWENILNIHPIGIHDDFFDLGGHSLLALQLTAQLEKQFVDLMDRFVLQSFFQRPTIAHLGHMLEGEEDPTSSSLLTKKMSLPERLRQGSVRFLPYPVLARGLFWYYGQRSFWRSLRRQDMAFLQRAFADFVAPEAIEEAIQLSLTCHYRQKSRCASLARHLRRHFEEWVEVNGSSHFESLYRQGKGVILVKNHVHPAALSPTVLFPYLQEKNLSYVGKLQDTFGERGEAKLNMGHGRLRALTSQLDQARRTLAQGGVALLAADGYEGGEQNVRLPFLGRLRPFKYGFAELAISTGAPVIPIHTKMSIQGKVSVTFSPPLPTAPPQVTREDRLDHLVQDYVDQLQNWWYQEPGTISWPHLERYLSCPRV